MSAGAEQNPAMTLKSLEDRVIRHADAAEAFAAQVGIMGDGNEALRKAEMHASLAASVCRLVMARTRRFTPKPQVR